MTIEAFAPAKINLTLHVTGQRADGYHLLDSLVVFADIGDRLWLEPGPEMGLSVSGPFAAGVPEDARNLVWQAAERAGWTGQIRLEKNLPHGAGIGGGSSDAGAVLRALDYAPDGAELGADVPVCKIGRSARMRGIGDEITPVGNFPSWPAVLVNPGVAVPTPAVFGALASRDNPALSPLPSGGDQAHWLAWLKDNRNDLEVPALGIAPVIADALADMRCSGFQQHVTMSGSGATCVALCPTVLAAEVLADEIQGAHSNWWVRACVLGGCPGNRLN